MSSRSRRRRGRWFVDDDLTALPAKLWHPRWGRCETEQDREWSAVFDVVEALAKHAVEARDAKMAGRCLAATALIGQGYWWLWQDVDYLFPDDPEPTAAARAFYVSGVYRRRHLLLRAEAVGLVWTIRWLYRAGLVDHSAVMEAVRQVWVRSRAGQELQTRYAREDEIRVARGA